MFLPDYQSVMDDGVRSAFTEVWDSGDFSNEKGLTVTEIMDAVHDGNIHGMYILGENPAMSDPDVEQHVMHWPSFRIWLFRIFS